jgi:Protein of unknown function (DUF1089).
MSRAVTWQGVEEWLAEHAQIDLWDDGVAASGVQLGAEPQPYRLDYHLDAPREWITRRLEVDASGGGWRRTLVLEHDGAGAWRSTPSARPSWTARWTATWPSRR